MHPARSPPGRMTGEVRSKDAGLGSEPARGGAGFAGLYIGGEVVWWKGGAGGIPIEPIWTRRPG